MPALTITIAALRYHRACNLPERIVALEAHLNRDVAEDEPVSLMTWAKVTPDTADLIWALRVHPNSESIAVEIALRAAERALPRTDLTKSTCEIAIAVARNFLAGTASEASLSDAISAATAAAINAADVAPDAAIANATYAIAYAAKAVACAARYAIAYEACVSAYAAAYEAAFAESDAAVERAAQRADLLALLME